MNLLIADETNIYELIKIGKESKTEEDETEIRTRINSKTDFYCICLMDNKIIAKCLIKKCRLTEDDIDNTYYLREVYKNNDSFKMKELLIFSINVLHKKTNKNCKLKLFVDINNIKAINLYKNLNFIDSNLNCFDNLRYTDEYYKDKTYYRINSNYNKPIKIIKKDSAFILIRPDRDIPFYKLEM